MDLIKALTPEDTEEVRPGVFLQKRKKGYRRIYPSAWNGKINWKNFIFGGPNFWKTLIWVVIILFMALGYVQDTQNLREFHDTVIENRQAWCSGIPFDEYGLSTRKIEELLKRYKINRSKSVIAEDIITYTTQ